MKIKETRSNESDRKTSMVAREEGRGLGESDIQLGNGGDPIRHLAPVAPFVRGGLKSEPHAISGPP